MSRRPSRPFDASDSSEGSSRIAGDAEHADFHETRITRIPDISHGTRISRIPDISHGTRITRIARIPGSQVAIRQLGESGYVEGVPIQRSPGGPATAARPSRHDVEGRKFRIHEILEKCPNPRDPRPV